MAGGRDTDDTVDDKDPGNGEVIGRLARSGAAEVDSAVQAALRAAPGWAGMAASARARVLREAADELEAGADEWGRLMTREMGKPFAEARVESARAAAILRFFAGEAHRPFGEQYASDQAQTWLFTRRSPVGVIGIITPWNFPAAIPTWKLVARTDFRQHGGVEARRRRGSNRAPSDRGSRQRRDPSRRRQCGDRSRQQGRSRDG